MPLPYCEMCRKKHDTIESLKAKIEVLEEEVQFEIKAKEEVIKERELILQDMVNVMANLEKLDSFRRMQGFGGGFIN